MKTYKLIALILLISSPFNFYGQCFSFTIVTTNPSCAGCCDGTATIDNLTGGCPPYSFVWSNGNSLPYTGLIYYDTTYSVTIIDAGQCCPDTTASARIPLLPTEVSNDLSKIEIISIYPNPNNGSFTIKNTAQSKEHQTLIITNLTGKIVYSDLLFLKKQEELIVKTLLNKGLYFVSIKNRYNEIIHSHKMIITK